MIDLTPERVRQLLEFRQMIHRRPRGAEDFVWATRRARQTRAWITLQASVYAREGRVLRHSGPVLVLDERVTALAALACAVGWIT